MLKVEVDSHLGTRRVGQRLKQADVTIAAQIQGLRIKTDASAGKSWDNGNQTGRSSRMSLTIFGCSLQWKISLILEWLRLNGTVKLANRDIVGSWLAWIPDLDMRER
jgi:hypothetical protein